MTKVFFEAGSSELTVVDNGVNVFGANGVQTLKLKTGALNVKADSNVDKFYFDGAIADFKFQQAGVTLKVFDSTDKLIVELGIQDDDDSTPLTFTDGTVRAALVGGANGVQIQVGSVAVNSAEAAKINVPALAIDTNEKSVATVQTPVVAPSSFTLVSSASNTPTPEGSNITFTVTPNGAVTKAAVLTLDFVGQALNSITNVTNAADFNSVGTISFNAGDTAAKQITVAVKNDGNPEGLEAYKVRLIDETGAEKASTVGTISDGQPVMNLSVNNSAVNEGGSVIFTLNSDVNAPIGGLVIPYNLNASTATNSLDFGITPATGTIIIPANEKSGSITVNVFNDSAVENAETVVINLDTASVSGVIFGNTSASTVINDTTATIEPNTFFFTGPTSVIEGTNAIYKIAHAPVSSPVTVDFKITPKNGLVYGTDYTIKTTDKIVLNSGSTTNGKITFDSTTGSSLTLEIETKTDSEIETTEVLSIELLNPSVGSIAAGQSFINTVFLDSTATQNGTTYPLVTNKDSITGSNSNDLISGYINTINSAASTFTTGDIIDGGAGVDTLQLVVDGADAGLFPTGVTVSNVEIINIKETGGIAGNYDLSSIAGVSTVINDKSTDDVSFVLPANAKFVVQGNTSNSNGNTTFDKATEITLANVNGGNITRNSTGSATITVNSTGTGNVLDTLDLDTGTSISTLNIGATANLTATLANNFNAATINISGSANKVDLSGAALSKNIASVNASLLTGGVVLKIDQNDRVSDTSITGGNGNDIIDIGKVQYSSTHTIDAGTGIDTLKISDQDTWNSKTIGNLKNFERLEIYDDNDDNVDTFDMSQQRSITSVQINASSEKDGYILNNLSATQAANITVAGNQVVAPKFNVTSATLIGNIDTINLNIDGAENISAIAVADIDASGIELVNLNIVDSFTATKLTGLTSLTTLAVAGNGNVNLTTGDLPLILNSTIDASALNGKLTVDASGAKNYGMLVKGSATQASVITGSAQADLLTGGAGADVLTGGAGADTFNGGAGADTLEGGEGADIINGGAGADFIVGGAGSDTLNGGSGDDTLYYATTAELFASNALVDKISGSSGFDTLLLAGGVAVGGSDAWTGATGLDSIVGVANTTASTITLHTSAEAAGIRLVDLSSNTAATGNKIEATSFSGAANLTLIGSATGANVISGGSGADVLIGGAGSDTISAGDGADVIYTNGGNDTIELGIAAGSTTPSADSASDSIYIGSISANTIKGFGATDKLYFTKSAFGNISAFSKTVATPSVILGNYAETATDIAATAPASALGLANTAGFVEVKAGDGLKLYYTTNMGSATTANSQLVVTLTGVSDTAFDIANITMI